MTDALSVIKQCGFLWISKTVLMLNVLKILLILSVVPFTYSCSCYPMLFCFPLLYPFFSRILNNCYLSSSGCWLSELCWVLWIGVLLQLIFEQAVNGSRIINKDLCALVFCRLLYVLISVSVNICAFLRCLWMVLCWPFLFTW